MGVSWDWRGARQLGLKELSIRAKVTNVTNTLYETFGYNYWDWWDGPYRVDVYWPAATRSYFVTVSVRL